MFFSAESFCTAQNNNIYIPIQFFLYKIGDGIHCTKEGTAMVILFDRYNLPEDAFDVIFSTSQQKIVAKELIKFMVENKSQISKSEMSLFATQLHEGKYECVLDEQPYKGKKVKLSYNKRQFYDRILTPMKAMGLIDYNLYDKTYKISTKFANDLMQIGFMWKEALKKLGASV